MKTLSVLAICLLLGATLGLYRYQALYQAQRQQTAMAQARLLEQQTVIDGLRERQRQIAALDARYISELNDAQKTIDARLDRCWPARWCSSIRWPYHESCGNKYGFE